MNFLKKIGTIALKITQIATGFSPLLQQVLPTNAGGTVAQVTDDLTKVAGMIQTVEVIGTALADKGISGPDKLKAAIPLVAQVVLQSEFVIGKKIKDETKFQAGVSQLASGMADILSSIEE